MRKLFLLIASAVVVVALAGAGSADAKCGVKCLNKKVRTLSSQMSQAQATINQQAQQIAQTTQDLNQLHSCFAEAPLTDYGDASGSFGYVFDNDGLGRRRPVLHVRTGHHVDGRRGHRLVPVRLLQYGHVAGRRRGEVFDRPTGCSRRPRSAAGAHAVAH